MGSRESFFGTFISLPKSISLIDARTKLLLKLLCLPIHIEERKILRQVVTHIRNFQLNRESVCSKYSSSNSHCYDCCCATRREQNLYILQHQTLSQSNKSLLEHSGIFLRFFVKIKLTQMIIFGLDIELLKTVTYLITAESLMSVEAKSQNDTVLSCISNSY